MDKIRNMDKTPIIYISIVGLMIIISVIIYSKIKKLEDKLVNDSNLKITKLEDKLVNDSNLKFEKLEDDMDTKAPILNPVFEGDLTIGRDPAKFDDNEATNHNKMVITPVPRDFYAGSSIDNSGGMMYSASIDPETKAKIGIKTSYWKGIFV